MGSLCCYCWVSKAIYVVLIQVLWQICILEIVFLSVTCLLSLSRLSFEEKFLVVIKSNLSIFAFTGPNFGVTWSHKSFLFLSQGFITFKFYFSFLSSLWCDILYTVWGKVEASDATAAVGLFGSSIFPSVGCLHPLETFHIMSELVFITLPN